MTNTSGQAIDAGGGPIPRLCACGNDVHSPFGDEYPGAGSQLGLGMVFGYIVAGHAATAS